MPEEPTPPAADDDNAAEAPPTPPPADAPAADDAGQEDSQEQADDIRDPEAYWKAQAEKNQRLLDKTSQQIETLKAQMERMQTEDREQIEQSIEELKAEAEAAKAEAETERVNLMRVRIAGQVGIPDALAARLQGSTEDEIRADAEAIKAALPKASGQGSRMGNPPGSDGNTSNPKDWLTNNSDPFGG